MVQEELELRRVGEQQPASGTWGTRAEQAIMRATVRAQTWYETLRAYQRAYAKSRHFRDLAD
jgi:hypothetical protein